MITVTHLAKTYDSKKKSPTPALVDVSLSFGKSGFVCFYGDNGSGKSTFLRLVGLLDNDFEGSIVIDGKDVKSLSPRQVDELRGRYFGYIFQDNNLISDISVKQNIEISDIVFQKQEKSSAPIGLPFDTAKKPSQLSGGQRQKSAICRALRERKQVFLCDEATASLDKTSALEILALLKGISKKCLVVFVTHDPEIGKTYADRIITLEKGAVVGDTAQNAKEGTESQLPSVSKKVASKGIFRLAFSFFLSKKGSVLVTFLLGLFSVIAVGSCASLLSFDSESALMETLSEGETYSPCFSVKSSYSNGESIEKDVFLSTRLIDDCTADLGKEGFGYFVSESDGKISFFPNSGIARGEASIGEKTLHYLFGKDTLDAPFELKFGNSFNEMSYALKVTSVFDGEGVRADIANQPDMTNNTIRVHGGLWLNSATSSQGNSVYAYLNNALTYVPLSYYNSLNPSSDPVVLSAGEALISGDLYSNLDFVEGQSRYLKTFLDFSSFSDQTPFFAYAKMNEVFPAGMAIIGYASNSITVLGDRYVVIEDSRYEDILSKLTPFQGITIIGNDNLSDVAKLFLNGGYRFNPDRSSADPRDYVVATANQLRILRPIIFVVAILLTLSDFFILFLFSNIIFRNDANKIGILRCMGLGKIAAAASSVIELCLTSVASITLGVALSPILFSYLSGFLMASNPASTFSLFQSGGGEICAAVFLGLAALFLAVFLLLIRVSRKQISDFFTKE